MWEERRLGRGRELIVRVDMGRSEEGEGQLH